MIPKLLKVVVVGEDKKGINILFKNHLGAEIKYNQIVQPVWKIKLYKRSYQDLSVTMQLWFNTFETQVPNVFYLGTSIGIIVFDISRKESFETLDHYVSEIWAKNGTKEIPLLLLGNTDNALQVKISESDIIAYCSTLNEQIKQRNFSVLYFPISASSGSNIEKALESILKEWVNYYTNLKTRED